MFRLAVAIFCLSTISCDGTSFQTTTQNGQVTGIPNQGGSSIPSVGNNGSVPIGGGAQMFDRATCVDSGMQGRIPNPNGGGGGEQEEGGGNNANTTCFLIDPVVDELSGMTSSSFVDDLFWVHNDDGQPILYALNLRGEIVATQTLSGAQNRDWEDIDTFFDQQSNQSFIYVGDIGDKGKQGTQITLYIFPEQVINANQIGQAAPPVNAQTVNLNYPGGNTLDFESLFVDPVNRDVYIFPKGTSDLYMAPGLQIASSNNVMLTQVLSNGSWTNIPSGADISPQGTEIIIRDEKRAYIYSRFQGESIVAALSKQPVVLDLAFEFNGEAVTYDRFGRNFYTASENKDSGLISQPILIYNRRL